MDIPESAPATTISATPTTTESSSTTAAAVKKKKPKKSKKPLLGKNGRKKTKKIIINPLTTISEDAPLNEANNKQHSKKTVPSSPTSSPDILQQLEAAMALMAKNKAKAAAAKKSSTTTGGGSSSPSSSSSPKIKKKKSAIHKKRGRRAPKGRAVDMTGGISTLRQLQTKARAKAKKAAKPSAAATAIQTGAVPVPSTTDGGGESNLSHHTIGTNSNTQAKSVPGTTSGNNERNGAVNPQSDRSRPTTMSTVSAQRIESIPAPDETAPVSVPAVHVTTRPTTPSTFNSDSPIHEDVETGTGRRSKKKNTASSCTGSCLVYSIIGTLMCLLLAIALLVPLGVIQIPENWSSNDSSPPIPVPTESSPRPSPVNQINPTAPSIRPGTSTPTVATPSLLDPSTHDLRFETLLDIVLEQYLSVFGNGGNNNSDGSTNGEDDVMSILMDPNTPEFAALSWLILQDEYIVIDPENGSPVTPKEEIEQRYALSVFFYATLGEIWTNDYDFLSRKPSCEWKNVVENRGVFCEGIIGSTSVTTLILDSNGLSGTLPKEVALLTSLGHLSLQDSYLEGTLPPELGLLTKLTTLVLVDCSFSGTIPPEFVGLESLEMLDFSFNLLSGSLPGELSLLSNTFSEFAARDNLLTSTLPVEYTLLNTLSFLDLGSNYISGTIPTELGQLFQLSILDLDLNYMTGLLPTELGLLTLLNYLRLEGNKFSGLLPVELSQLTQLRVLWLQYNVDLSGTVPIEWTRLTALEDLRLTGTALTGDLDPIFCIAQQHPSLQTISAECGGSLVSCSCCSECCPNEAQPENCGF